jgi:biopolymer transport protein ExbB
MLNGNLPLLQAGSMTSLGTLYETILDGGWMMIPIAFCSIVAFGFFVERYFALSRGRLLPRDFGDSLDQNMGKGIGSARSWLAEAEASMARILKMGLQRFEAPRPEVEKAIEDAGSREVARLSGNLRPLVVISAVAPLLGLLGTVIGMIKAFQTIALEKGIGKPELLAEGISEALVTTAAGLIVAIPAQVAYYYLKARIDRFARQAEVLAQNLLDRHHPASSTA